LSTRDIERQWLSLLERELPNWDKCDASEIERLRQSLVWGARRRGGMYSPNTIDQALRVVRSFYRWALTRGHVCDVSICSWKLPRPHQPRQPVLTRSQALQLFNLPDLNTPAGLRDSLLLELLYVLQMTSAQSLSLRLDQVASLQLDCVRPTLERYLARGRPLQARDDNDALLLTAAGRPLKHTQLIVRTYGRRLGLPYTLSIRILHRSAREHQAELHRRLLSE